MPEGFFYACFTPIYSKRAGRKGKKPPGVGIYSCALQPNLPASKNRNAGHCSLAQRRTFCFGPHPPAKWKNLSQLGRCLQREKIEKSPKTIMHSCLIISQKPTAWAGKPLALPAQKRQAYLKQSGSATLRDGHSSKRPLRKAKQTPAEEFSHRKSHRPGRWLRCAFYFSGALYGVMGGWFVRCSPMIFSIQII